MSGPSSEDASGTRLQLPDDFRDLVVAFSDRDVEFVVVGGYAVAFHGHIRATKDLDVLVRATPENADRVVNALASFGAPLRQLAIGAEDFVAPDRVVQLGLPPLRIDILTSISGVDFDTASKDAPCIDADGRKVLVIGRDALLANKRASGRPQDLADVAALEATTT